MLHLPPREILKIKHELIVEKPQLFIPGLMPIPQIIGATREINPGSQSWNTPGTYSWTVPLFNDLFITCYGAGGGGSGAAFADPYYGLGSPRPGGGNNLYTGGAGATGGYGQWYAPNYVNMVAYGGTGGPGNSGISNTSPMPQGAHGQGYNGNTANYNGNGASGGAYGYCYSTQSGSQLWASGTRYGGYGGNGGRCDSHFTLGQIPAGTVVTIVIQAGGGPGYQYTNTGGAYPVSGSTAAVGVSWN